MIYDLKLLNSDWWNKRMIGDWTRGEVLMAALAAIALLLVCDQCVNDATWGRR